MYVISTIRFNAEGVDDQRPVGYFDTAEKAALRIENNVCDIFEDGYYQYAVIVEMFDGLYPAQREIQWYAFNRDTHLGYKIERPELKDIDGQDFRPYILG